MISGENMSLQGFRDNITHYISRIVHIALASLWFDEIHWAWVSNYNHYSVRDEITHLKLKRDVDKWLHPTLDWTFDNLSMVVLKLIHVSKRDHISRQISKPRSILVDTCPITRIKLDRYPEDYRKVNYMNSLPLVIKPPKITTKQNNFMWVTTVAIFTRHIWESQHAGCQWLDWSGICRRHDEAPFNSHRACRSGGHWPR